jgi:hypothetical protein
MDALASFSSRLRLARAFLGSCFAAGFLLALWDPHPRLILTAAIGITTGMLALGPSAAAALYTIGLQRILDGYLRWPLCAVMVFSSVYMLDYLLAWEDTQFALASFSALLGTILGHDASLAVLKLKNTSGLDPWMVLLFPLFIALALLAGYSSFGFAAGSYQFAAALLR